MKMELRPVAGTSGEQSPLYDIVIEYNSNDAEFALEFLSHIRESKTVNSIEGFIKKHAKNAKINAVKIVVSGMLIASIPFSLITSAEVNAANAASAKFSMTYLYGGTVAQQIAQVKSTNGGLNTVSPSYYDINSDGSLKINTISKTLVDAMHADGIKVVPFLSNHWDRAGGIAALKDPEGLASKLAKSIAEHNLDGINVDIENVTQNEKDAYTALVKALRNKIPAHKEVSVAVAANPSNWQTGWHGSYDYTKLAQNSDYLMIMAYDQHYQGGTAGPVAGADWVEKSIAYALNRTTPDKIVVGLPFFGRMWSSDGAFNGHGLSISTVESMISDYKAAVTFDAVSKSPRAEFTVKSGDKVYTISGKQMKPGKYTIWYENERSLEAKVALVHKYNLKGIGSWALGQAYDSLRGSIPAWLSTGTSEVPDIKVENVQSDTIIFSGTVMASSLNIRGGPGTNNAVIGSYPRGDTVTLIGEPVGGWYEVRVNSLTGYVSAEYISLSTQTGYAVVETTYVRKFIGGPVGNMLSYRDAVTLLGKSQSGWYKAQLKDGSVGYVPAANISTVMPPAVNTAAQTGLMAQVSADILNVRQGSGTKYPVIATLKMYDMVSVVSTGDWHKIRLSDGTVGYVSSPYVTLINNISAQAAVQTPQTKQGLTAKVNADILNVRQGSGTKHPVIAMLSRGETVSVISTGDWYKIKTSDGTVGYVSAQYVTLV